MGAPPTNAPGKPDLSVIVPIRDRWNELDDLLESLASQENPPDFEVVVVDDGSRSPPPDSTRALIDLLPARMIRTPATGIGGARNSGVGASSGTSIAFIDSDCIVARDFLDRAWRMIESSPGRTAFQARITGSNVSMVSRIEHVRVGAVTASKTLADGTIAYVNTSGFFIRRDVFDRLGGFDETVLRAEDSLMLAQLLAMGHAPILIPEAVIEHRPRMRLPAYVCKHFMIGRTTARGRTCLAGVDNGRLSHTGRIRTILEMKRFSREHAAANLTVALTLLCYAAECVGRIATSVPRRRP